MSKSDSRSIVAVALAAIAVIPFVMTSSVVADTTVIIAIYALVALSVGLTYGLCGILSVAQASFAAMGAYVSAILTVALGWSPWISLVFSILVPACFAYPIARLVTRLSPLALAVATLMFGYLLDGVIREGGSITGGYIGLSGIPVVPGAQAPLAYHLMAWVFVLAGMLVYARMRRSYLGLAMRTIRSDALRAAADGVDVSHFRSLAMSYGAALAGAAGWLYVHHLSYIGPDSLGPGLSLSALLMAVVGGVRTLGGPVLGAVILTLIIQFIPGQESLGIFYGGALIVCLLVAPEGLSGLHKLIPRRWKAARSSGDSLRVESEALRLKVPPKTRAEQ